MSIRGKSTINGQFSKAILNHQRLNGGLVREDHRTFLRDFPAMTPAPGEADGLQDPTEFFAFFLPGVSTSPFGEVSH